MTAVKACLIGEANVGKTTIANLLQHKPTDGPRKPTIGIEVNVANIGDDKVAVWDLAGQRRFQFMWDDYLRGAAVTFVVTDSTPQNVMITKDLIERHLNNNASKIIAIANKQDVAGAMNPDEIQAALGIPTYGLVATDRNNEAKLKQILEKNVSV
jgi:small GTP-binding protein